MSIWAFWPAVGEATAARHSHPDIKVLTFGCPACVECVRRDQEAARWADAPLRRCRWTFVLGPAESLEIVRVVRVPAGAGPVDVAARYREDIDVAAYCALTGKLGWTHDQASAYLDEVAWVEPEDLCTIGALVPDVTVPATAAHPSLFGE